MSARFVRTLPLLIAAFTLWRVGPEPLPSALIALLLLVAMAVGPKLPLDKPTQRLASLVVLILVIAGVRAAGIPARSAVRLGAFAFGAALAPLCVAALRLSIVKPDWGYVFTLMLGFCTMLACGATRLGPLYGVLVASYLAAMIAALRADDPARRSGGRVPRRAAAVGAAIVLMACAFTVGAALVLRPIQLYAQARVNESFQDYMLARVSFSDSMHLGRMTRLLQSNRVVLRLRGPRVDRLRGAVLDRYDGRRWLREGGGAPVAVAMPRGPLVGDDVVEIRKVGDDSDRLFLPHELAELATHAALQSDGHGIARMSRDAEGIAWLRAGPRAVLPIATAGKVDLDVLPEIVVPLQSLARAWTDGAHTQAEALWLIERRLKSDFRYSLSSKRRTKRDPIVDFLFEERTGHCEYFASSMALLARTVGIPTRVVTGYRVAEHNPLLGHYVVRERNAHAWVEAWLPERGWVAYDPTPMAELQHNEPFEESGVTALSELFAAGAGRVEDWLAERTVGELSLAAIAGLVIFGLVRALGARSRARGLGGGASAALSFSSPLDVYVAFESRLARSGHRREPNESLETFAERVPERDRGLVLRYARARYGKEDDERIEAELRAALEGE